MFRYNRYTDKWTHAIAILQSLLSHSKGYIYFDFLHWTALGKSTFLVTMFLWYSATSRRSCWVRFSFSSSRRLSRSSCWNSRSSKCLLSTSSRSASFGEKGMKTRHTRMAAAFLTWRKINKSIKSKISFQLQHWPALNHDNHLFGVKLQSGG